MLEEQNGVSPHSQQIWLTHADAWPLTGYTAPCMMTVMVSGKRPKRRWDSQSIKALRRHLGLTQTEMAARLGTRQQTISEWENGMYQPRGASATLLSIVAEGAAFKYDATESNRE